MTAIKNKPSVDFLYNNEDILLNKNVEEEIIKALICTLNIEELDYPVEVSINFVTDNQIKELNNTYRKVNKATDVLSFPAYDSIEDLKNIQSDHEIILGDVAINLSQAQKQAEEIGHSVEQEVLYLSIHSFLHLLGYDHMNDKDKVQMRNLEKEILTMLKNDNG